MNNLLIPTKQHEKHIFNGLAHFIKGGVFVGFGIITLGRWIGCFAEFGWAWNLKPSNLTKRTASISMETVECFVIFLYGITNVFLEHLSAWGEAWVPQDLEHVGISLLFIGGGLVGDPGELTIEQILTHIQCGLMVESKALRRLVEAYPEALPYDGGSSKHLQPKRGISINPIPAMIIFLLGMILGGHHQMSTESTMMHKQVTSTPFPLSVEFLLMYLVWKPSHFRIRSTMLQLSTPSNIPTNLDVPITSAIGARLLVLLHLWRIHAYGECKIIHSSCNLSSQESI